MLMSITKKLRKFFFLLFAKLTGKIVLPEYNKDATKAIQAIVDGKNVYTVYGDLLPLYTIPKGIHRISSTIQVKKGVDIVFGNGIIEVHSDVAFRFEV